jgi:hypothetical protein
MYVKVTNGTVDTYPYNVGQLRRDNPNTSFPKKVPDQMLADYGIFPVTRADAPSIDTRTQVVTQKAVPELVGDNWVIGWDVSSKTSEEIKAHDNSSAVANRSKRDALLSATDWVVIMHTEKGTNIPADMELYRQSLRDITSHVNWPHLGDDDWPVKP